VTSSISVAQVHGDADPIVHYGGGRVFDSRQLDPHPSAPDTIRQWAARLDCTARQAPRTTHVDLDPRLPGAETTIESRRCPRGTVELWTVHGGQHQLLTADMVARIGGFLLAHPKPVPKASKKP
jgi:polyhydroxybutyrate depolymerase